MMQETWLADLIQETGNEIYILDAATLSFLHVNHTACNNLLFSKNELLQMKASDLLLDLNEERIKNLLAQLGEGKNEQLAIETMQLRKDGSLYPISLRIQYLTLHAKPILIAIGQDRSNPESDLLDPLKYCFTQAEAHLPGVLFQLTQKPGGEFGFPFLSADSKNLLSLSFGELQSAPDKFSGLILQADLQSWLDSLRASAKNQSPLNWEGRIWIADWHDVKWINVRATPQNCGSLGVLWTGLMNNITEGKLQTEDLSRSRKQLATLAERADQIREEERASIARDLHDDLGGNLIAIKMALSQLRSQLPAEDHSLAERASYLEALLGRTVTATQNIATKLRPAILDDGLVAALEWQAQEFEKQTGISCQLISNANVIAIDRSSEVGLFRLVQEACTNIAKHAHASGVELHLHQASDELLLEIIDNGVGMTRHDRSKASSYGLRDMKERAAGLGGDMAIASRPGKGTLISVRVPFA
jgi:PAS domain S-box-containing protein